MLKARIVPSLAEHLISVERLQIALLSKSNYSFVLSTDKIHFEVSFLYHAFTSNHSHWKQHAVFGQTAFQCTLIFL